MLIWAFLFGAIALVFAAFCGAEASKQKGPSAVALGLLSLCFETIYAFAIFNYIDPMFPVNAKGVVIASYASTTATPRLLRERNVEKHVFIIRRDNGREYKITSNDLRDKNKVLKVGDRVHKDQYTILKDPSPPLSPRQD